MSSKTLSWIVVLMFLLFTCSSIEATTRTVDDDPGEDFTTIQAAINASSAGDIVYVFPGLYQEQVTMADEVNLVGFGAHVTTIDGQGLYDHVVTFNGSVGATLSGFRVIGSAGTTWHHSGVYVQAGPLLVRNNILEGNHGGISVSTYANPTIINNTIVGNSNGVILGVRATSLPAVDVAIIYDSDYTSAFKHAVILQDSGFTVDLILLSNVVATDFSDYGVIIVGSDTGSSSVWGTSAAVTAINSSGKPILGLGDGGYAFFGKLGLATGFGYGWHGSDNSIYVVDTGYEMFNGPNPISIPGNKIIQLYSATGHVGINLPVVPGNVIVLGREVVDLDHYPLTFESGRYLFWGFTGSPANMTADGADLFVNVVSYLHPIPPSERTPSHTIMNNIIANNTNAGIFYYSFASYDAEILYNDVWNNTYNYYQNGPIPFVPQPGTGEISVDPLFDSSVYHLAELSPCKDTGHPGMAYNDPDGSRNDMGVYGGPDASGLGGWSGSGFIFTSVGDVPTASIIQNSGDTSHGLADVSASMASDFGIPQYQDSPFGGLLKLYGLFGNTDTNVDYYQILVGKWTGSVPPAPGDYRPLNRALAKVKYIINPDFTVSYLNVSLGPKTISGVDNLYQLTTEGYWYHVDQRILWDTRLEENGKYTITYRAYQYSPPPLDSVTEVFPTGNSLDELTVIIDNTPITAEIHNVKYDPSSPNYDIGTDGKILECGIISLANNTENLRFNITAKHPNGYLLSYKLDMVYGKNHNGGVIATDSYTPASPPSWVGVEGVEVETDNAPGALVPWQRCAYQFRLRAYSRVTNGSGYIYSSEFSDHYFLDFGISECALADLDDSGGVNFVDLEIFTRHWAESCAP